MRPTATLKREDRARLDAATDWMMRLQADDLNEEQLSEWLAWYDVPANRIAFDEMQEVEEDLRLIDPVERAAFTNRILSAEPVAPSRPTRRVNRIHFNRWSAAALGTAAMAFTIMLIAVPAGWFSTAGVSTAYRTGRGEHREVRLPDDSVVALAAQSSLSINFTSEGRYLVLEGGEALFTVTKDPSRPFVVQAGRVRVRAIGTQFNVRRADESTFVAVKEGVVEVAQDAPSKPGPSTATLTPPTVRVVRVAAGEQVHAPRAEAPLQVAAIAPEAVAVWQQGRLEFVDESLRTVVATVNRYSSREIVLTDPAALGDLRFTGIVMESRIDDWVNAIQEVFPLKANAAGRGAILLSPASP